MKKKTNKQQDLLIYKGERYVIMIADKSEVWQPYEVKNSKGEIEPIEAVQVFLNIRAVRVEKSRRNFIPRP